MTNPKDTDPTDDAKVDGEAEIELTFDGLPLTLVQLPNGVIVGVIDLDAPPAHSSLLDDDE